MNRTSAAPNMGISAVEMDRQRLKTQQHLSKTMSPNGRCSNCFVQTHRKWGGIKWVSMTTKNAKGKLTVYKGFCVKCHQLDCVKEMLGEIPTRQQPEAQLARAHVQQHPRPDARQGRQAGRSKRNSRRPKSLPPEKKNREGDPHCRHRNVRKKKSQQPERCRSADSQDQSATDEENELQEYQRHEAIPTTRLHMSKHPVSEKSLETGRPSISLDEYLATDSRGVAETSNSLKAIGSNVVVPQGNLHSDFQRALRQLKNGRSSVFCLTKVNLPEDEIKLLAETLLQTSSRPQKILALEGCKLSGSSFGLIAQALQAAPHYHVTSLTKLKVPGNALGDSMELVGLLQQAKKLSTLNLAANSISDETFGSICSVLCKHDVISKLCLSHNKIQLLGDTPKALESLVSSSRSLEVLNLEENAIRGKRIIALTSGVLKNQNSGLKKLYLSNNPLGDEGMQPLSDMLRSPCCQISYLTLKSCHIKNRGANCLLESLSRNESMIAIAGIEANSISDSVVCSIQNHLAGRETHPKRDAERELSTDAPRILGPKNIHEVCQILRSPHIHGFLLQRVQCVKQQIDNAQVELLASALMTNSIGIVHIQLSHNSITSTGACILADAFQKGACPSLGTFDISWNPVGNLGVVALSSVLVSLKAVRSLAFSGVGLGGVGVKALMKNMMSSPVCQIESLHLDNNTIEADGAKCLAEFLIAYKHLEELTLHQNSIGIEGVNVILRSVETNSCNRLVHLSLAHNGALDPLIDSKVSKFLQSRVSHLQAPLDDTSDAGEPPYNTRTELEEAICECDGKIVGAERSTNKVMEGDAIDAWNKRTQLIHWRSHLASPGQLQLSIDRCNQMLSQAGELDREDVLKIRAEKFVSRWRLNAEMEASKLRNVDNILDLPVENSRSQGLESASSNKLGVNLLETPALDTLTVFRAAPLVQRVGNKYSPMDFLDFSSETTAIQASLREAADEGLRKVQLRQYVATRRRLSNFFIKGGGRVIQMSCHGSRGGLLGFEDGLGELHAVTFEDFRKIVSSGNGKTEICVLSACHTEDLSKLLLESGVKHVVACKQDERFQDAAAIEFASVFWLAAACGKDLRTCFNLAKDAVRSSPRISNSVEESEKFLLLPERDDGDSYHAVPVFFVGQSLPLIPYVDEPPDIPQIPRNFIGRELAVKHILTNLNNNEVVVVQGAAGVGLASVVAAASLYIFDRKRDFHIDEVVWVSDRANTSAAMQGCKTLELRNIWDYIIEGGDTTSAQAYEDSCLRFAASVNEKVVLVVMDCRKADNCESLGRLQRFLAQTRRSGKVRFLVITRKTEPFCLGGSLVTVEPLSCWHSARLFARCSKYVNHKHRLFRDEHEFAQLLFASHSNGSRLQPSDHRERTLFNMIGRGLPHEVRRRAETMSEDDFRALIRRASRPAAFVSSRADLEAQLERAIQRKKTALQAENFEAAQIACEQETELLGMMVDFPSADELRVTLKQQREQLDALKRAGKVDEARKLKSQISGREQDLRSIDRIPDH